LAVLAALLVGCGGSDSEAPPQTPFAAALATVGGGGANGSLGVGWAEPSRVEAIGAGPKLIAAALAPNAASVIESAPRLRRRFDLDPLRAQRLISVGGSYAFGLRLDGLGAPRLERALAAAGGREREVAGVESLDVGGYASVPDPLRRAGVLGLGARDAFTADRTVLAISDTARAALLGAGDRLLDEPTYVAAASCLGDGVVAVRLLPAKLLLSTELGFSQLAVGVADGGEVICALGAPSELAERFADQLRGALSPGAREPRTGRPITAYVSAVSVSTDEVDGVEVVRAEITPAAGRPPGFVFDAVARGSIAELVTGD